MPKKEDKEFPTYDAGGRVQKIMGYAMGGRVRAKVFGGESEEGGSSLERVLKAASERKKKIKAQNEKAFSRAVRPGAFKSKPSKLSSKLKADKASWEEKKELRSDIEKKKRREAEQRKGRK